MPHPLAGILLKVINVFRSKNLALLTVASFQSIRKRTKYRNSETKYGKQWKKQDLHRSKDRETKLINKEV